MMAATAGITVSIGAKVAGTAGIAKVKLMTGTADIMIVALIMIGTADMMIVAVTKMITLMRKMNIPTLMIMTTALLMVTTAIIIADSHPIHPHVAVDRAGDQEGTIVAPTTCPYNECLLSV